MGQASTAVAATQRYRDHLAATLGWLRRSERPAGGSSGYYAPLLGWSRPYPETTGYIVPTLIDAAGFLDDPAYRDLALRHGEWLLRIQNGDGSWNGGFHPPPAPRPSVFNTAQILDGMLALGRATGESRWLDAGVRGMHWLRSGMAADGLWNRKDYRSATTPSYYAHALWPMLAVAVEVGDADCQAAVRRGIDTILGRRLPNGVIAGWSFAEGRPAFTHTIAYTVRGIQECGDLFRDPALSVSVVPALEKLAKVSELQGGRLPGHFDESWRSDARYVCLTGNAQVALSLLLWERDCPDLRIVSAAARLVDVVCGHQRIAGGSDGVRGAVGGSQPLWGRYMRFRYPNWAAKYLADALLALVRRLEAVA